MTQSSDAACMSLPSHRPRPEGLPLALEGVRVIDFSRVLAGPYGTQMLADLGADVIKIENPRGGDDTRFSPPFVGDQTTFFLSVNRNKRSITLDLSKPEGRQVALDLIATADILVESFTTSVMRKYGLDYETLATRFPRLIYLSISGYGRTGSRADAGGMDPIIGMESGIIAMTGPEEERPQMSAVPFVDIATGVNGQFAVLAALYARERLGKGQHIDVSLYDVALASTSYIGARYLASGQEPQRLSRKTPSKARSPSGEYDCRDRPIYFVCYHDRHFRDFCSHVVERPELADDPRFVSATQRAANVTELEHIVADILRTQDAEYWVGRMQALGIPAGVFQRMGEALRSAFTQEREMVSAIPHPSLGSVFNIEPAFKRMSLTPPANPVHAPLLGQHTREILSAELGYSSERIAALEDAGVVGRPPVLPDGVPI